jgi:hypothetical protein
MSLSSGALDVADSTNMEVVYDDQVPTNDDYEDNDEYEEVVVVASFHDLDESFILKNSTQIDFHGIGTSHPSCVIDGRFKFQGNYEHSLGIFNITTFTIQYSFHLLYQGTQLLLTSEEQFSILDQTDRSLVFKLEGIEPKIVESNITETTTITTTTTTTTENKEDEYIDL